MSPEESWLNSRMETTKYNDLIESFMATIRRLSINQNMVHGNIMVGGCGGGFPERGILCSSDSNFSKLEPWVNSLTCADPDFFTSPELILDDPVEKRFAGKKPNLKKGHVTYFSASLQMVLPSIDTSVFDTVLFFRIQKLQEQLHDGLSEKLQRVVKSGGYLLGSGSFHCVQDCTAIFQRQFNIDQIVTLSNPDFSGYAYREHVGFILRKK